MSLNTFITVSWLSKEAARQRMHLGYPAACRVTVQDLSFAPMPMYAAEAHLPELSGPVSAHLIISPDLYHKMSTADVAVVQRWVRRQFTRTRIAERFERGLEDVAIDAPLLPPMQVSLNLHA